MINTFKIGDRVRPYGYVEFYDASVRFLNGEGERDFWFIEDYEKIFGVVKEIYGEKLLLNTNSFDMCMGWIPVYVHHKQCEMVEE